MNLIRRQPATELVSLRQAMERLFDESFFAPYHLARGLETGEIIPIDMYYTPESLVVKASLPGLKPEEVDISIEDNVLTIKGETKAQEETKEANYIYREQNYGTFGRSVNLPTGLELDKIEAAVENGTLTLTIPKSEEIKPKQIKIKAKGAAEGER